MISQQELVNVLLKVLAKSNQSKYGSYDGPDLEAGGTSIKGKEVAALKSLIIPSLKKKDIIIDYGAGKYARNADYLRNLGYKVYAYDPFNGGDVDGFKLGNVSLKLPNKKFSVGFTSFVLNVVKDSVEDDIISSLKKISKTSYHIVRNDIVSELQKSINSDKSRQILIDFVKSHYPSKKMLSLLKKNPLDISLEMIADLAMFGYQTSKGFQRLPMLENKGYTLLKKTSGWKAYKG